MFYDNYIRLCAKAGKSPSGVAREIGLSNAAANGWKKGKLPNDTTLSKLSSYFDVPVFELTGEEQKESPPHGGEPLDPVTRELIEFVETASNDERRAALEMVKLIKKQRGEQNG